MFKAKTVATVFSKFTKDLTAVAVAQETISRDAIQQEIELSKQADEQAEISKAALKEKIQAQSAIRNIGELLGITEGSLMTKKT